MRPNGLDDNIQGMPEGGQFRRYRTGVVAIRHSSIFACVIYSSIASFTWRCTHIHSLAMTGNCMPHVTCARLNLEVNLDVGVNSSMSMHAGVISDISGCAV